MKIGILTQPLHSNYGGLMQNYALQKILMRSGCEVYTINKNSYGVFDNVKWYVSLARLLKRFLKKNIGLGYMPSNKEHSIIIRNCTDFVKRHIFTTERYITQKELLKIVSEYKFNAFVVGSDQIWRPCYSDNIYNDFLDFCRLERDVKRIAYAVSFGVQEWEFSPKQTKKCRKLVELFNAVSVREDSGTDLCRDFLGVNAELVLDPTFLLEKEEYIKLIEDSNERISQGNLFCYLLDDNNKKEDFVRDVERKLSMTAFRVLPSKSIFSLRKGHDINDYTVPSPTKWLRAFMDSELVLTDSYHGCVFSIIFNKPFWVIGNKERGNARFDSLLRLFGLEKRMISVDDFQNVDFRTKINWDEVNAIKKEWQNKSLSFINSNLFLND